MTAKLVSVALLLSFISISCASTVSYGPEKSTKFGEESAIVQEVSFKSKSFTIVGDLRLPEEGEVHSAIIMVHGSGHATRNGAVPFNPMIEIFLRNGYAVFSWDKPGSGESTGELDGEYQLTQRAAILSDGIGVLAENKAIDSTRIGLWGISQAGWVMPLASELSDDIAFMIVVSGGGEDSIEQMAYRVGQQVICNGGSTDEAALVEQYWSQQAKATDYTKYREAMDILIGIIQLYTDYTLEIAEENEWKPWPSNIDAFFDPMDIIEHTTIPVLAFFGKLDKNIDPVQGAEAYESALLAAGNHDYQIECISGVAHILMPAQTGCIGEVGGQEYVPEYLETLEVWLQHL